MSSATSTTVPGKALDASSAGPSSSSAGTSTSSTGPSASSAAPPHQQTGIPVVDTAAEIGPQGVTYEEEFERLKEYLRRGKSLIGPAVPVIFVNIVRKLYVEARRIASSETLTPYNKCVSLFHIFDAIVLAYKNLSFVYCDSDGARSVYGYSDLALKNLLARVEAMARQVAVGVHDAYSLTTLNRIVSTTRQRLNDVRTEQDMLEFFRSVSGRHGSVPFDDATNGTATNRTAMNGGGGGGGSGEQLPRGIEPYSDPYSEVATLVERLYATNSDKNYIRDFHDCMFLVATANAPATLASALDTRLADKDRNIVLFEAPGDRLFASSMCASAIGFLRKRMRSDGGAPSSVEMKTYRINYGRIFSKYRGESERNFDVMMEWIKNKVRASESTFRVFWFPDIENLMSPRTSNDQEHIATIKTSMLQHMDAFNKDRTLRSFLLLFNSSEGQLDSAFSRRIETVVKTPSDPLTDSQVATQVVGAELARYHINVTDDLVAEVAIKAGTFNESSGRVGGLAYVQATLRDWYVYQKLLLSRDARAVETEPLPDDALNAVLGRYAAGDGTRDILYDLDERPLPFGSVGALAFSPASRLSALFDGQASSIKYNASVRGDPKNIDGRAAARTIFLHDIMPPQSS